MTDAWLKFPRIYLVTLPVCSLLLLVGTLLLGFRPGTVTFPSVESAKTIVFYISALVFLVSAIAQVVIVPLAVRRLISLPENVQGIGFLEIAVGLAQLIFASIAILMFGPAQIGA